MGLWVNAAGTTALHKATKGFRKQYKILSPKGLQSTYHRGEKMIWNWKWQMKGERNKMTENGLIAWRDAISGKISVISSWVSCAHNTITFYARLSQDSCSQLYFFILILSAALRIQFWYYLKMQSAIFRLNVSSD